MMHRDHRPGMSHEPATLSSDPALYRMSDRSMEYAIGRSSARSNIERGIEAVMIDRLSERSNYQSIERRNDRSSDQLS